jgi:hypothetical protein
MPSYLSQIGSKLDVSIRGDVLNALISEPDRQQARCLN